MVCKMCLLFLTLTMLEPSSIAFVDSGDEDHTAHNLQSDL